MIIKYLEQTIKSFDVRKKYTLCATCRPWGHILLYCIYRHSLTSKECIVFCWKKTIIFIWKYAEWKMLTYSYEEDKVEIFMLLFSWKPTIQSKVKQCFITVFRSSFISLSIKYCLKNWSKESLILQYYFTVKLQIATEQHLDALEFKRFIEQ